MRGWAFGGLYEPTASQSARRAPARRGEAIHDENPEQEREQLAAAIPACWTPLAAEVAAAAGVDRVGALQAALFLAHYRDGRARLRQKAFPTSPVMVQAAGATASAAPP